ncbi:MAG: DUF2127 domain-containing protein [bacterium]|nr:DUF2127 domain-containing protein [bacterium]
MKKLLSQAYWHKLFAVGVLLKGLNSVWGTLGGFLILFLSKETLNRWFSVITQGEQVEDPSDKVIAFLAHALQNVSSSTQTFVAFYMLLHGILNIFLTIQLARDKHWAYLVTIGITTLFLLYQVYRISVHHSLVLLAVTLFDILFVFLTWHEYRHHTEKTAIGITA